MKKTLGFRLRRFLFRPRQCIITDAHSRRPARKIFIRPVSLILFVFLTISAFIATGAYLSDSGNHTEHRSMINHLQLEQGRLKDKLAETEALLSLRDQQIESMNQEIAELRQQKAIIQDKVNMFSSILDARKNHGVHLLQLSAHKLNEQSVGYSFVLVKGGNYPRTASGSVRFSAVSPSGERMAITLENGENALPYRTQSHTFMQGELPWDRMWRNSTLHVTVLDRRGKEIGSYEATISAQ